MREEVLKMYGAFRAASGSEPRRLAIMEGPTNCNRACGYCDVPKRWDADKASTLSEALGQVDRIYEEGYRVLNYVGGEPLARCKKKGELISRQYHRCERGMAVCPYIESEKWEESAPYNKRWFNLFGLYHWSN